MTKLDFNLPKLDIKNLKPKEIWLWAILFLNFAAFLANVFAENLFFVLFNGAAVAFMIFSINHYYKTER